MIKGKWRVGICLLGIVLVILSLTIYLEKNKGVKEIHSLAVPGNGMLLVKNNGMNIVIGGGEVQYADEVYTYLKNQEVEKIDLAIWTEPTQKVTGAYSELIYEIPIDCVYSYSIKAMDDFTDKLSKILMNSKCRVEESLEELKINMKEGDIQTHTIQSMSDSNEMATLVEIKLKGLRYLWIANASPQRDVAFKYKKELKTPCPDVLNLGESKLEEWIEEIDDSNLKVIIVKEKEDIGDDSKEKNRIIMDREEGGVVIYKGKKGYEVIGKRGLEVRIL